MEDYFGKIQEYFQKSLEGESLTNSREAQKFEQALILLEEEPIKVNALFKQDDELKTMFGFTNHQLQIILSESETESENPENESDKLSLNSLSISSKRYVDEIVRIDKTTFPEMHPGYATGRGPPNPGKKRKGPEDPFFTPEKPERFENNLGKNILNLDCRKDRKTLIDRWAKEISLIIQTNTERYNSQNTVLLLLDHTTIGSVNKLVKDTRWQPVLSPIEAFTTVVDAIYMMFIGIDFSLSGEHERQKVKTEAQIALTKMQLCDICYLEEFYCEYEKYFYDTGDQDGYKNYVIDYIKKIPLVGKRALARFNAEKHGLTEYSLAFAHKIVKEEIAKTCDLSREQKQLKSFSKKCCNKIVEKNFSYGCQPTYNRNKKKENFKRKTKYSFKLHCYVDTGASLCIASQYVIPPEHWVNAERPIQVKIANGTTITIDKVCKNLDVLFGDTIFHIPTVYQQEAGLDFLIGNNFCLTYSPFTQFTNKIIFTTLEREEVWIRKVTRAERVGFKGFLESMKKDSNTKAPAPVNISSTKIYFLERGRAMLKKFHEEQEQKHIKMLETEMETKLAIEKLLEKVCSESRIFPYYRLSR